ncbi:DUF5686 and carboxypeptidase regulatory-like domain-containing protein [Haliscomenobacter sp.]|uniref:DUF5686 and carboxypeptidase regulatory-like domain-containing protein n=1 Tax=Haliscomenobacter sp. TaxID=2717303 RepID=UPI003594035E
MQKFTLFLLFTLGCTGLFAQLSGKLTDTEGAPLPFASIYIKGSTNGTTSNVNGEYSLSLSSGSYEVIFQYIGYESKTIRVNMTREPQKLNVSLNEAAIELSEFVVRSNAEDPAYPIIRAAIKKREFYRDQVEEYRCDAYVKGNIGFDKTPKKIMGQEIGTMGGLLDSTGKGIIYLSESRSTLFFRQPAQYREEMIYSKVAGNDQGFGFNRAQDMDFSPYDPYSNLGRRIVSPIADNAFFYYKYKLIGTITDDQGQVINKIQVIPKRSEDPVYRGYIYIVDQDWAVQSVDYILLQSAIKQPGLDSLWIKQLFFPVPNVEDVWRTFSVNIRFKAGALGFKLVGSFNSVLSNYDIKPALDKKFFGKEVFIVKEGANDQSQAFWDTLRPIPLTAEESRDYVKKDSLQTIWKSKPYKDSIDKKNNKFTILKLFTGYSYNRSFYREYFSVGSPLGTIQYNTVQGYNAALKLGYNKDYDEYNMKWYRLNGELSYGFSEKKLRVWGSYLRQLEGTRRTQISLSGGQQVAQFNAAEPITPMVNSVYSLLARHNYMKLYDKVSARFGFSRELANGLRMNTALEWANRSSLQNTSDQSWYQRDAPERRAFTPNLPTAAPRSFDQSRALSFDLNISYRPGQKYYVYPGRKYAAENKAPEFFLNYRLGAGDVNYQLLSVAIEEDELPLGAWGFSQFRVQAGTFLQRNELEFMDFMHFNGNQTILGDQDRYMNSFLLLPYYDYSTDRSYFQAHWQHHFEGAILDWIPLVKKLGWKLVLSGHLLQVEQKKNYLELAAGIENVGFGVFRLFRFDMAVSRQAGGKWNVGPVFGISL